MFFKLNPEPCGGFGRKTLYGGELTDRPPQVYRFHFEFDKWPATDICGINCTFLGPESLVERLKELSPRPTGIVFEDCITTASAEFRKDNVGKELPPYKWFKIVGKARVDDFGLTEEHELMISDRVFALLS